MTRLWMLGLVALLAACPGTITEPGAGGGGDGVGDGDGGDDGEGPNVDVGGEVDGAQVGGRSLRRLTVREYDNTMRDVFGLGDAWPGSGLSPDLSNEHGFDNDAELLEMDGPRAEAFVAAAEKIADLVVDTRLGGVAGCGAALDRACATAVIDQFGPALFHRAMTDAERDRYLATYDALAAAAPDDAVAYTIVALLSSPNTLYRFELGQPAGDGVFELTGEEIATSLAYTFSASPPSAELLARGRNGELATPEARLAEARRLLDSPRGHAVIEDFTRRWLRYDEVRNLVKDPAVVPGFDQLRGEMAEETRRFLEYVIYEQKAGVRELLTSNATFVTAALAQHYGLPQPAVAFGLVERPPEQSFGILSQGAMMSRFALTSISSPPQRGAFIERHLRCRVIPPPPPTVGEPPIPEPGLTTRELYEDVHSTDPSCAGCHRTLDGMGFGLEGFDTAGRWRAFEQGKPIDASGRIVGYEGGADAPFIDGRGMATLLADSTEVAECAGGLMATYAYGTSSGHDLTDPKQVDGFVAGSTGIYDFFVNLAAAPHFTTRIERVSE